MELVYYDTNIWVSWSSGLNNEQFPFAKKLIDSLCQNKIVVIVPDLILLETIHALRKILLKRISYAGSTRQDRETSQSKIEQKIKGDFTIPFNKLEREMKIKRIIPSIDIIEYYDVILKKMKNNPGRMTVSSICPKCHLSVPKLFKNKCLHCHKQIKAKSVYKYKGLDTSDFGHAYLAQLSGAKKFYSFDLGFQDLKKDKYFNLKFINCMDELYKLKIMNNKENNVNS